MRRLLFCFAASLALALIGAAFGPPGIASADPPITAGGSGVAVDAQFFTEVDGVQTSASVSAGDDVFSDPFGGTFEGSHVQVFISKFDPGNPRNPRDDETHDFFGFADLAPEQFQAAADLDSATLSAVVNVCEGKDQPPTGPNCFDLTVSLTWSATGETQTFSGRSVSRSDGCKVHSNFSNSFREATAAGSVSDGVTNFTPNPSGFGAVHSFSFNETFIGDCFFEPPPGEG